MADPKPVSQQVEEETTTDDNVVNRETNTDWWKPSIPSQFHPIIEKVGIDAILNNEWVAAAAGFSADLIADLKQELRDKKDQYFGPDQISFTVAPKATTGDDDRTDAHKSSLRYPSDSILESTEYMLFQFYRYSPPLGQTSVGTFNLSRQLTGQGGGEFGTLEEYNLNVTNLRTDTQLNQVVLYMPPDISSTYGAEWGDQSFSNTAVSTIRAGMALREGNIGGAAAGGLENLGGAASRFPEIFGADRVRETIAKQTGEQFSRNDLFSSAAGVVLNPNTELLFKNPHMRTIDFTYKLIPNNKDEAEIIYEIVRTFKRCLHPSFGRPGREQGGKAQGLGQVFNIGGNAETKVGFITVPSVCKFAFMKGNDLHPFLPQYKTCALVGVDVNYTTDGQYVVTRDGYPVSTELRLSFKELKLVYREDIMPSKASTVKQGKNKKLHGGH